DAEPVGHAAFSELGQGGAKQASFRIDYVCIDLAAGSCQLGYRPRRAGGRERAGILRLCDAPAVAVTSKDIARRLNISQSTVSRALRGDPRVSAETKARILEAARQMDYTPNLAARSLITRKSGTIGLIVSDITNPFYPELLGVLHNEFALAGYRTVLFDERNDAPLDQHVAALVNGAAV